MKTNKTRYLVNFKMIEQGFSEIVEAQDKQDAIDQAKIYLAKRFTDLKYNVDVLEIYSQEKL